MKSKTYFGTILGVCLASAATADPPKVLSSSPAFWATAVDSRTQKTVSIEFDQQMREGFHDWFGRDGLSPKSTLHTTLTPDGKTMMIDVTLTPGKVYVCALNERGIPGVGFQNEKGLSLPPTYLVFQTAGNSAPDDMPPNIVRTLPESGTQIDSTKVHGISVTFDRPMNLKKHGLQLTENGAAVDLRGCQSVYSQDGRTFNIIYQFKPATQYRVELNNNHNIGFSSAKRVPMWPVQIAFTTSR